MCKQTLYDRASGLHWTSAWEEAPKRMWGRDHCQIGSSASTNERPAPKEAGFLKDTQGRPYLQMPCAAHELLHKHYILGFECNVWMRVYRDSGWTLNEAPACFSRERTVEQIQNASRCFFSPDSSARLFPCQSDLTLKVSLHLISLHLSFPCGSVGKESTCKAGDPGLIPGWGRSSGEGNGNPLQYSCLENSMERRVWWTVVHGVAKSHTQLRVWVSVVYTLLILS